MTTALPGKLWAVLGTSGVGTGNLSPLQESNKELSHSSLLCYVVNDSSFDLESVTTHCSPNQPNCAHFCPYDLCATEHQRGLQVVHHLFGPK